MGIKVIFLIFNPPQQERLCTKYIMLASQIKFCACAFCLCAWCWIGEGDIHIGIQQQKFLQSLDRDTPDECMPDASLQDTMPPQNATYYSAVTSVCNGFWLNAQAGEAWLPLTPYQVSERMILFFSKQKHGWFGSAAYYSWVNGFGPNLGSWWPPDKPSQLSRGLKKSLCWLKEQQNVTPWMFSAKQVAATFVDGPWKHSTHVLKLTAVQCNVMPEQSAVKSR